MRGLRHALLRRLVVAERGQHRTLGRHPLRVRVPGRLRSSARLADEVPDRLETAIAEGGLAHHLVVLTPGRAECAEERMQLTPCRRDLKENGSEDGWKGCFL